MNVKELSVLVLDDKKADLDIIGWDLADLGVSCDAYQDEEEALQRLTEQSYHLIIADTKKGDKITGPVVVRKARELGQNPVVIALSADSGNKREWADTKYDYFFEKTYFNNEKLRGILKEKFNIDQSKATAEHYFT